MAWWYGIPPPRFSAVPLPLTREALATNRDLIKILTKPVDGKFYFFICSILNRKVSVFVKTSLVKGRGTMRQHGGGIQNAFSQMLLSSLPLSKGFPAEARPAGETARREWRCGTRRAHSRQAARRLSAAVDVGNRRRTGTMRQHGGGIPKIPIFGKTGARKQIFLLLCPITLHFAQNLID